MKAGRAPGALPGIGHVLQLWRRPLDFLSGLSEHGDLVEVRVGTHAVQVLCHPDLARSVLVDDRTFDKGGPVMDMARQIFGNGLITCPRDDHRRQRRLVQPAFHHSRLPGYGAVMSAETAARLASWQDGQVIDLYQEMRRLTFRISARTLFGQNIDIASIVGLEQAIDTVLRGASRRFIASAGPLNRLPTPGNKRYARAVTRMREVVSPIIEAYREGGVDNGDLVSMLLVARDESGDALSDDEVHDQVTTLFFSGAETSANAIAWTLHMLERHPEVAIRVHEEVDAVLAGRPPEWADLPQLTRTRQVVEEVLRLYPPAWLLTRTTTVDTELAGRRLPAGTTLLFSPYVIHQRGDLYPEPGRFNPWRADTETQVGHRGPAVPFGQGPRQCIGESFAWAEAVIVVASVVVRWQLVASPGASARPMAGGMLGPPRPLSVRLQHRPVHQAG